MVDENSAQIMRHVDKMTPAMRALVHEYGFSIVYAMRQEGYTNAKALRPLLETWRQRRQQELLDSAPPSTHGTSSSLRNRSYMRASS
jgi:hypothetical protein